MARPGWYSDHPSACTCVACSERGGAPTTTAERRWSGGPPARVGSSVGGSDGGGSAWKWLAAIVIAVLVGVAIYQALTRTDDGQPTPANAFPTSSATEARSAATRAAPSPVVDYEATTEAGIAATVEALTATSTPTTAPAPGPTPTPTRTPTARPTRTATPVPILPARASFRDFVNGPWLEQEDPRLASSIKGLDWMRDGIDAAESQALQDLLYIAVTSRAVASSLVSLGWVQDGISDDDAAAIDWINNIGGPGVMTAVVGLAWVQDGIDDTLEVRMIEELSYIDYDDAGLAMSVVSLDWVQDGISDIEADAIGWIGNVSGVDVASAVVALEWVQDGIDNGLEVRTIEELSYVAYGDAGLAMSVVSLGWVRDGIGDIEAEAVHWIGNIGGVEVASAVVGLAWVQDGVDGALEVGMIEQLSYIAYDDTGLAMSVVSLDWVQDGIDDIEAKAIDELSQMAYEDALAAARIVGMPFLATIEPPDVSAVASLWQLAADDRRSFEAVMAHAPVRDGISDDLAPIVATLHGVAETNPALIPVLLHPANVTVERRAITLPLAGDVVLAIIRTGPGAPRSMDLLERGVRGVERLMGLPLPTNYVGLLFENAVYGPVAGTNFGTHVAVLPEYDVDDDSREAGFTGSHLAHEVAHYYWSGNADWVDEGAADLVASIVDGARTGRPVGVTNRPCAYASTIAELERFVISKGDDAFRCNYSLGERLFIDLYRTLGEDSFLDGFRALYMASEMEDDDEDDPGTSVGIEHVRAAFRSDDGGERAVIARWYDGTEPHDRSSLDYSPVDPRLPTINGRIEQAFIVTERDGPATAVFSARDITDWVLLTLAYSYSVSGAREVQLEIVEYFEDGFEFSRRTASLTAEPQYIGGIHRFSVGSPPQKRWATGRYFVYVYEGDRKVAEVEYEVIP